MGAAEMNPNFPHFLSMRFESFLSIRTFFVVTSIDQHFHCIRTVRLG